MSTATQTQHGSAVEAERRVDDYDWPRIARHLDAHGWALLPKLLTANECATMVGLYTDDSLFRSHIVMARHGFGRGEYKYFAYPLPDKVTALRTALYPHLAPIANRWSATLGLDDRYPDAHAFRSQDYKIAKSRPVYAAARMSQLRKSSRTPSHEICPVFSTPCSTG